MRNEVSEEAGHVLREAGVKVAYLFGSTATGRARQGSDVDIAVLLDGEIGLLEQEVLADRLARGMKVAEVDLLVLDRAPLELRGRVIQEDHPIYSSDEPRRMEFEVRTRSEYFDFLPTLQEHTRRFLERVAREGLGG
jgi:predicted nucleotidyltransferase